MTPERAQYHLLMLRLGEYDEYDRELDRLLEEQDPLSPLVLELAFCMSDRSQTISVLYNFLLDSPADEELVYQTILTWLRKQYMEKAMTPVEMAEYMSRLMLDNYWQDPWDRFYDFTCEYELFDEGLISQSVFETCFDSIFLQGVRLDPWKLQGEENQRKTLGQRLRTMFSI